MAENRCVTRLARASRSTALAVAVLGVAAVSTVAALAAPAGPASVARPRAASVAPWNKAGPGWAVFEYSGSTTPQAKRAVKGAEALYLTSPQGKSYPFYTWPASYSGPAYSLVDWSGDRQRVLVAAYSPLPGKPVQLEQISLATGKVVGKFTLPSEAGALGYTRPSGLNLLAMLPHGDTEQVVRYNLAGRLQTVLASGKALTGAIDSPDGTSVIVGTSSGLEQVGNTGSSVRRFSAPVPVTGCDPVRWWSSSTVLAWCSARGIRYYPRLWLFPVGGGKVTALTPQREGHGPDYGDVEAWRLSTGDLYLKATGAGCSEFIGWQWQNGTLHQVAVPGTANNNTVVTGFGSRLLVQAANACPGGGNSLLWVDPITSAIQFVFPAEPDLDGVVAVVPFDRTVAG